MLDKDEKKTIVEQLFRFIKTSKEYRLVMYWFMAIGLFFAYGFATGNIKVSDFKRCESECKELKVEDTTK